MNLTEADYCILLEHGETPRRKRRRWTDPPLGRPHVMVYRL